MEYDLVDDTDPQDDFAIRDLESFTATIGDTSFANVIVKTPSVEAFPPGLLMLMLTVEALSLEDKCPVFVEEPSVAPRTTKLCKRP